MSELTDAQEIAQHVRPDAQDEEKAEQAEDHKPEHNDQQDPKLRQLVHPTPGQPRTIRARTGLTTDPVPHGKKVETPSEARRTLAVPESEDAKALAEQEALERKHELSKKEKHDFQHEMQKVHQQQGGYNTKGVDHGPPQDSGRMESKANMLMDSRHRDHGIMESRKH